MELLPGLHPIAVRGLGFKRGTVPALKIDGRRVQGSLTIARYLEQTRPEPALYPADSKSRRAVEEAEHWGEAVLQPIPRRLFRFAAARSQDVRRWVAAEVTGMPLPGLVAAANKPVAYAMGRHVGVSEEQIRADLESLPTLLDRVDGLIADGTLGGLAANAADLQIFSSIRSLQTFSDLAPLLAGSAVADAATRFIPEPPGPVPAALPPAWLPQAQAKS